MFCKNCGAHLDDRAVICPHCGTPTENYNDFINGTYNPASRTGNAPAAKDSDANAQKNGAGNFGGTNGFDGKGASAANEFGGTTDFGSTSKDAQDEFYGADKSAGTDYFSNADRSGYASGQPVQSVRAAKRTSAADSWFMVLGFFFPVVGLILYLIWQKSHSKRANACGMGAIGGVAALFIVCAIFSIAMHSIAGMTFFAVLPPMC